ncbi:MAG: porin [Porticoccaceae bacterium]|nr:porin [Porticoccaceae bacterium]
MKKVFLLASLIALSALAPFTSANASIDSKLYGKINLSVVNTDNQFLDGWKLNSNASRIGLKGTTQVSEGLTVFYKTEFEVCVDDGDCKGNTLGQRNIYAGIRGGFGSILAGNSDTPTKQAQNKIDLFGDLEGDIKKIFAGENRMDNIVAYSTPSYGAFSATYAVMPNEEGSSGISDTTSYSVSYNKDGLYVAVAGDSNVKGSDILRVVSQYKFDAWQLGLMYQENDTTNESGYFASTAYKCDDITYKAQYGANENDTDSSEKTTLSLGADYKLANNTKAYAFYTDYDIPVNATQEDGPTETFGLGLEHKF